MPKLSIIILSYNTRDLTRQCLETLLQSFTTAAPNIHFEIVVVDNASTDGSPDMLRKLKAQLIPDRITFTSVFNRQNVGYPKGNNQGMKAAHGEYILFLNSDVLMKDIDWTEVLGYMDDHPKSGALTIQVNLPSGSIDPASHRGFPTIWNAFGYYSKLEQLTKHIPFLNALFGGYHLTHKHLRDIHEIDSPSGAFYLTRKTILDEVGGFDETYFMYGEDLDLSYRIKEKGYDIIYYPRYHVVHLKYQSGLKQNSHDIQIRTRTFFYDSMKIFYKKHYEKKNWGIVNRLVYFFIDLKSKV